MRSPPGLRFVGHTAVRVELADHADVDLVLLSHPHGFVVYPAPQRARTELVTES